MFFGINNEFVCNGHAYLPSVLCRKKKMPASDGKSGGLEFPASKDLKKPRCVPAYCRAAVYMYIKESPASITNSVGHNVVEGTHKGPHRGRYSVRRTSVVAPLVGARPPGLNILPGPILNLPIPTPVSPQAGTPPQAWVSPAAS